MNFRNKYAVITVRVLLGLIFLFSGITGFLAGKSMNGVPEAMIPTMQMLWNTGIFQLIKTTEIVAGLMLLTGFFPQLAALFLAPLCIGIIIVNSMISPAYLPMGVLVTLMNMYLGYAYWDKYKAIFNL